MTHYKYILALLAVFLIPHTAYAVDSQATVYFESSGFSERASSAYIDVFLDTSVPVNAYNIEFSYDSKKLVVERIDTANSIISVMPEPVSFGAGRVSISGGSTKPFSGSRGLIMRLFVRALSEGSADFEFSTVKIYQADGKGTLLTAARRDAIMNIRSENIPKASISNLENPAVVEREPAVIDLSQTSDLTAPRISRMEIRKNPFDSKILLLVFEGSDDMGSIATARVRTRSWFSWTQWQEAVNPYGVSTHTWQIQLELSDGAVNKVSQSVYRIPVIHLFALGVVFALIIGVWIKYTAMRSKKVVL